MVPEGHILPEGLVEHCAACRIVVPADAPRPEGGECAFVAKHRLVHYNPRETVASRFCMAAAAWALIYHKEISATPPHAEALEYLRRFKRERKAHYQESATHRALAPEQRAAERKHARDGWLYD